MQPLANVYRGNRVESFHSGSIAIVDSSGRVLAYAGDPHMRTFLRSAAKPFQSLPHLQDGAAEKYDLTGEEIALMCGSHGGESFHVSTAAAILRKGEFDESDLLCGAHIPYDEKTATEMRQTGEAPNVLHNNCSGKHAGMLLATQLFDLPSTNYTSADHPLQLRVRQAIADFAGLDPEAIPLATDGCGVPSYYLSLYRSALAYARLAVASRPAANPEPVARYAEGARRAVEAMTAFPDYVAGAWSMTTPLIEAFDGALVAKEGAEGFYAIALRPPLPPNVAVRLGVSRDVGIGITLKIADGSMTRGRDPVVLRVLELAGLDVAAKPSLQKFRDTAILNMIGDAVGEVRAEFDLTIL